MSVVIELLLLVVVLLLISQSFSNVRKLRDNSKPPTGFQAEKLGCILQQEHGKCAFLNGLDIRKPLVVCISQRSEELTLHFPL
jgi:hypothetical protein